MSDQSPEQAMPPEEGAGNIPPEIQKAMEQVSPPEDGGTEPKAEPEPILAQQKIDVNNPTLDKGSLVGEAVSRVVDKLDDQVKRNADVVPSELAPRWELLVREARNAIKEKRDQIKEVIGERPYQGFPLDKAEAEVRYIQMRESVELQTTALEANIQKTKEGRILINKEYLKAMIEFEERIRKGEIAT